MAFGGGTVTDWVKLRTNANQRIEFQGASGKTTLVAATPSGTSVVTIKAETGTLALLSDIGDSIFGPTAKIFVDAANTGDGLEDGSEQHPFDLIGEGFTASSAGFIIVIAPGVYAEALVVPHDLFIDGDGATGMTSVDLSSGDLSGQLGKLRYYAGGILIYPVSNAVTNGDCFEFALQVSSTTAKADEILLLSGTYDVGARDYDILGTTNASNVSFIGVGAKKAHIITSAGELFIDPVDNDFTNLTLEALAGGSGIRVNNSTCNSKITHVDIIGQFLMSTSNGTFNGSVQTMTVSGFLSANSAQTDNGSIHNLSVVGNVTLKNYAGNAHIMNADTLILEGDMSGNIVYDKGEIKFADDITGSVKGIRTDSQMIATGVPAILINLSDSHFIRNLGSTFQNQIIKAASKYTNCKAQAFFQRNSFIEEGVLFERVTHEILNTDAAAVENKGNFVFNHFIHDGMSNTRTGLAVSTGAHIHNSIFEGYSGEFAIRGRELLGSGAPTGYGSATLFALYDATGNRFALPLSSEPQKSDGAGSGTISTMVGDTFDARVIQFNDQSSPTAGEELSNLEGFVFEVTVIEDVDTTPADGSTDIFGFSTTVGVSIFVIHSTAQDATEIENLLSNPASDLTSNTLISFMAQAATITMTDVTLGGGLIAPEISIIGDVSGTKTVTLIADDTVINMTGSNKLSLDSDSGTATDRTFSFDLASLVAGQDYIIYFTDAADAAEWADGGADSAKLAGTITFAEDDTIHFIYDGSTIRELGRSAN